MDANRLKQIPTSIFATMSKLAFENKAINLGQGFPDFDGPDWIKDAAYKAMKDGKNQYAPMNGIYSLRSEINNIQQHYYNLDWDVNKEITITAGATEALLSTLMALINPGDEVIVFEPFYDAYQSDIFLAGGIPKYITLKKPNFNFDFDELEQLISKNTRALILNNPHNPTGKVFSKRELLFIAEIAIKNNLIIISDEVYEFLLFDGNKHIPIVSLPNMKERTVTISSTGKTFGMTGWKVGFALANPELTSAIQKVHQWATFAVNTPAQYAMAYAFGRLDKYLPDFRKNYQQKRDLTYKLLKNTIFTPHLPDGSYFMMVDIPESINKTDVELAQELVIDYKVATIPPSVFYAKSNDGQTMLRLCFAKNDETLKAGIKQLKKYKCI